VARFAADQNFDARNIAGLLRRMPDLEIVHIRDVGLAEAPDPSVLTWVAAEGRVLLTHDRATPVGVAY
jgi:predicted nuclease of predicted toxin-antitoxin system